MPKCDFNKVANNTSAYVFPCKFAEYFQNTFSKEHLWRVASMFNLKMIMYGQVHI